MDVFASPFLASRRTRNRVSETDRARLCSWYVASVASGDPNPARTLAKRYPQSSYKTWANIFSQARTQVPSLMTEAPRRGVAGGVLTDHAEALLRLELPTELQASYEGGRMTYEPELVAESQVMTRMPERSEFSTDEAYDRAYEDWLDRDPDAQSGDPDRYWFKWVPSGPVTYEDSDDWWNRVSTPASQLNPDESREPEGFDGPPQLQRRAG